MKELEQELCDSEIELARLETEIMEMNENFPSEQEKLNMQANELNKKIEGGLKRISIVAQEIDNLKEIKSQLKRDTLVKIQEIEKTFDFLSSENASLMQNFEELKEENQTLKENVKEKEAFGTTTEQDLEEKVVKAKEVRAKAKEIEYKVAALQTEKDDVSEAYTLVSEENEESLKKLGKADLLIEQLMTDRNQIKGEGMNVKMELLNIENELNSVKRAKKDQQALLESLKIGMDKQLNQVNSYNQIEIDLRTRVRRLESISKLE